MKSRIVQFAALSVLALVTAGNALAADKVAVIQIMAIDGLDMKAMNTQVSRDNRFTAGSRFRVNKAAVPSLSGVKTLVLVERRADSKNGSDVMQKYTQEIITSPGAQFTVRGLDGKDLTYTADVLRDGSVDLIGPGDRIVVRDNGEFHIWKVQRTDYVDPARIVLE